MKNHLTSCKKRFSFAYLLALPADVILTVSYENKFYNHSQNFYIRNIDSIFNPSISNKFINSDYSAFHMTEKYYLDTSIWLDFFENRNESNLSKGDWAHKLLDEITKNNHKVIYSDIVILELGVVGYQSQEIEKLFEKIKPILIFVESTEKQMRKAGDLSSKRNIPKGDALHALIARDNKLILVTLDNHFKKLLDIIEPKRPQDLI